MSDAAFWDRIAPKYAKSKISDMAAYETTLSRTKTYLSPTSRVLEFGCGTGTTALKLAGGTASYIGTDIAPGMVSIANEKLTDAQGLPLSFAVSEVKASAANGKNIDVVLAFNLLHLVRELETALKEIHAILPQGGLFISKTAAIGENWYFRPLVSVMAFFGKAPFVHFLTSDQIDAMIAAAGFELIETDFHPAKTPRRRFVVARKL